MKLFTHPAGMAGLLMNVCLTEAAERHSVILTVQNTE